MALPLRGPSAVGGPLMEAYNALQDKYLEQQKNKLFNQFYGPNIESEINQRKSVTEGQNIFNQYAGDKYGLENATSRENLNQLIKTNPLAFRKMVLANAQQEVTNQLMSNIVKGNQNPFSQPKMGVAEQGGQAPAPQGPVNQTISPYTPINSPQSEPPVNNKYPNTPISKDVMDQIAVSGGILPQQQSQMPPQNIPAQPQPMPMQNAQMNNMESNNGVTYPQAAMASHLLGMGQPKIIDVNGTQVAITPFGNIPVAQGLTPQQETFQKGLGKYESEFYGENVKTAQAMGRQSIALQDLADAVTNAPGFRDVTGPIGSFLTKWAGNPEQKELLGRLQSSSGEISLQIAPSLKGAWTGRDQQMIDGIKANPKTDFPDVFIGKLKAQTLINTILEERAKLAAKYTFNGMNPIDALEKATKETELSKYRPIVDKLIKGNEDKKITIWRNDPYTKKRVSIQTTLGEARRKYGIRK